MSNDIDKKLEPVISKTFLEMDIESCFIIPMILLH